MLGKDRTLFQMYFALIKLCSVYSKIKQQPNINII